MKPETDVLEHNVSSLLEGGGEPPRMSDAARVRIREALLANHGAAPTVPAIRAKLRTPLVALGLGLAAAAVIAFVALRFVAHPGTIVGSGEPQAGTGTLADGTTYVARAGSTVAVLGSRHVRVTGAVLLDVVPGKGEFVVDTARGRIEVLGTKFFVDAEADQTIAAVLRGVVKLIGDSGDLVLHAGDQGVLAAGRAPVRGPAPRLSELVSWSREVRREVPTAIGHHGTLFARDPGLRSHPPWGVEYPLPIMKLGLDIVVEDQVARVAIDQTFRNEADQELEGVYRFAIPPDAALQRLAMYVDGTLMESAVVERMSARRIYEDLVYRRVDPALLEWAGAGRLALRVYPLPAHQDKRLALAYTQSLPKLYDDWTLTVPLPDVERPVGELDIAMRVKGCAQCELSSTSYHIAVTRDGDDAIVRYHGTAEKIGDALVVRVRDPRNAVTFSTASEGDDRFALVRTPLDFDRLGSARAAYRPRTWVILDDVSASRDKLALGAQTDVVDALMRELDEDDRVAVVAFDAAARVKLGLQKVRDVDRAALRRALGTEGGIGATDVAGALDSALPLLAGVAPEDATIIYLGDGVITTGATQLDALRAKLAGKAQFVGVGLGDGVDTRMLAGLAAATGGYATTIDLADDLDWRALDLVAALRTSRITGLAAKLVASDGSDVAATAGTSPPPAAPPNGGAVQSTAFVRSPQLADGEQLELVAKLTGKAAPAAVLVTGTRDGKPWSQRIALAAPTPNAGYLPRLWAQRQIDALLAAKYEPVAADAKGTADIADPRDARDEQLRQQIVELGKRYFLLSRHTSLLVLENDAMYAQYGVKKGDGATWAPYAMPATIPTTAGWASAVSLPVDLGDTEVVRRPLVSRPDESFLSDRSAGQWYWKERAIRAVELDGRFAGGLTVTAPDEVFASLSSTGDFRDTGDAWGPRAQAIDLVENGRFQVQLGEGFFEQDQHFAFHRRGSDEFVSLPRFQKSTISLPVTTGFDDLTGFVPALLGDDSDAVRAQLRANGTGPHSIDSAARALLQRAHDALPTGVYRWGDREIALDSAHHVGWRTTTPYRLAETAAFDGARWTRRYLELGLDVTRDLGDDDIALALGSFPIWIAEPAHWAKWFDVTARGPHEVALSATIDGAARVEYVLRFDDRNRLIAITDGDARTVVAVSWTDIGPSGARVRGEDIAASFTPTAIADAVGWANPGPPSDVALELPEHAVAYWTTRLAAQPIGTPAWRQLQRELIASLAADNNAEAIVKAFFELAQHGGISRGDVALASLGIAHSTRSFERERELVSVLAPLATDPLVVYLLDSRNNHSPSPRAAVVPRDSLIGTLWTLRSATHATFDGNGANHVALDMLQSIDERAIEARRAVVELMTNYGRVPHDQLAAAWEAIAVGPYRNVARARAAQEWLWAGHNDRASERIVDLMSNPDLDAFPPVLEQVAQTYETASSNDAGWQLLWHGWSERVLAGRSFAHVMAMVPVAARDRAQLFATLQRASELAGDDVDDQLAMIAAARQYGLTAWADGVLEPLVQRVGTRDLHILAGRIADSESRFADALGHYEAAFDAGGPPVARSVVAAELRHMFDDCAQLALQSHGRAHTDAVARAKHWADRGRELDLGDATIDRDLGELLLREGDRTEAWRYLSSGIDRDPYSSAGYVAVATVYAKLGKLGEAQPFLHQAVLVDQTNPALRLQEAQELLALGRTGEGKTELHDIVTRQWHSTYAGVVENAKAMLAAQH